ncbi:MAG: preprotein translocase subunit Sec61beta [Nanobdellota archaeon]
MAKNNKVNMPSSTAGITRYFDDYKSKIELSPGHVIVLCLLVMIILAALHTFGNSWLGLG